MNSVGGMRWCLGRSSGNPFSYKKKRAADDTTTPADVVVVPSNRPSSAMPITPVAAEAHRYPLDGLSEPEATAATEHSGDSVYCATTASSRLRFSGRSANGEPVRTRPGTVDGLSSSYISFVEELGSQPMTQHEANSSSSARVSAAGAGIDALSSIISGNVDGTRTIATASSTTVATVVTAAPPSSLPTIHRTKISEEELIAEIQGQILRRGVLIDHGAALGAARVCLTLLFSREPTPEAMQQTGPTELVSLARSNLAVGAGAAACLLTQLVDNQTTAARLAVNGTDFGDSHRECSPCYGRAGGTRNCVAVLPGASASEEKMPATCLRHQPGEKTANPTVSRAETVAPSSEVETVEATAAATFLSEACRAWGDIIGALSSATTKATSGKNKKGSGVARMRSTTTGFAVSSPEKKATTKYPPSDTSLCYPLKSPRSQCRPPPAKGFSSAAAVAATRGAGHCPQDTQQSVRYTRRTRRLEWAQFLPHLVRVRFVSRSSSLVGFTDYS